MKLDLDRYNSRITEASKEVAIDIQSKGLSMNIEHRTDSPSKGDSLKKIKASTRESEGAVNQVSIKFPRVLIYTHKGAGKGRGGGKGSRWLDKFGNTKRTNPNSLGKQGAGGRTAKPFINDVLESPAGVDKIATIAAEELGDAIVNNMLVK